MKNYDISNDIYRIRTFFNLSQEDFAVALNTTYLNINRWENGKVFPNRVAIESIYSYAYKNNGDLLDLNSAKEMLYEENKGNRILLFHGAKKMITAAIDNKHSVPPNDFGDGFYLGENLHQAATWICDKEDGSIYVFYLDNNQSLIHKTFNVDRTWMYAILYYRGALDGYALNDEVKGIIDDIEKCDYLIAPIADNQMYDVLNSFKRGEITDEACIHALSCTNLGKQYVLKSDRIFEHIECIDRLYLCKKEKETYLNRKISYANKSMSKANLAKIQYRRKGKYFDELFKKS